MFDRNKKSETCGVCFRHCVIPEGETGFCRARVNRNGRIVPENAGRATGLALDPIEKKPLKRFYPGSMILSYGSYGCNLRCPFCQNFEISQSGRNGADFRELSAEQLADLAVSLKKYGNIGIAFTYNEPMTSWEYIRETGELAKERDLRIVLVTNGTAELSVLEKVLPFVDAMNIDLKSFSEEVYRDYLKGDLETVKAFIVRAVRETHVELTTLIVPGRNDTEKEMERISAWIASIPDVNAGQRSTDPGHPGRNIPLHISRYFPRWKESAAATEVRKIYRLRETAAKHLKYVYAGNCQGQPPRAHSLRG